MATVQVIAAVIASGRSLLQNILGTRLKCSVGVFQVKLLGDVLCQTWKLLCCLNMNMECVRCTRGRKHMAKKFTGAQSGKSNTRTILKKGLQAPFAGVMLELQQDLEVVAHFEWDRGYEGSSDEPPEDEIFEVTRITSKANSQWIDDSSNYYCKIFKNTNIIGIFDEETLKMIDEKVKQELAEEAYNNMDEPELKMHKQYWCNKGVTYPSQEKRKK
jgi:hypothetical protein